MVTNIRGGGEFGPKWHQAALKKNRKKSYENTEGGHAGASNKKQRVYSSALDYAYLYKLLMGK